MRTADFDGKTYDPRLDRARLSKQLTRIFQAMQDGSWKTLEELEELTGDPQASISARLRDFRKEKFGGFVVEKRRKGESTQGLWEYRVLPEELAETRI